MSKRRHEKTEGFEPPVSFEEDVEKSRQADRWNRRKQKRRTDEEEEYEDDDN